MFLFGSIDSIVVWDVLLSHLEPSQLAKQAKSWCAMIQKSNSSAFSTEERLIKYHHVIFSQLLTCTLQTSINHLETSIDGFNSLMSLWSFLQTDLNICRAAFKFKASLEQRQTFNILHPHFIRYVETPIKNTLTPPLPTEESHRSCSRGSTHCGR